MTLVTDKLADASFAYLDAAAVSEDSFRALAGGLSEAESLRESGLNCWVGEKVFCLR